MPSRRAKEIHTFSAVTGLIVGRIKMILTNVVQSTAHALTQKEALPILKGPGSRFPLIILQMIGIQQDQLRAMAVILKMAAIAVYEPRLIRFMPIQLATSSQTE